MGEPSPGGSQTGLQDDSGKGQHDAGERGEGWISPQCVPDGAQPQVLTDRYQRGLDRAQGGRGARLSFFIMRLTVVLYGKSALNMLSTRFDCKKM